MKRFITLLFETLLCKSKEVLRLSRRTSLLISQRIILLVLLLTACGDRDSPTTRVLDAQTVFSVSHPPGNDAPKAFIDIDWAQTNKITMRGLSLEKYPVFIGEIDSADIFPFYMESSVVSGSLPVVSSDGDYLALQSEGKIYIARMDRVVAEGYSITPASLISTFDERFRCRLAWSPYSSELASVCLSLDGIKIGVYSVGSNSLQDLFQHSEINIDNVEGAAWSPGAAVLAFALRYRHDDSTGTISQKDIFLYHLDGDTLVRVTNSPDDEQYPDWFPSTGILTFTHTARGDAESLDARLVFSTDDGKCMKQVPGFKGIVAPTWSPDGSKLAFISEWMDVKVLETSQFIPSDFLTPQELCTSE